jgi:hypothetical protein
MTKDEILNMPAGREMDALIAEKVMGWKRPPSGNGWNVTTLFKRKTPDGQNLQVAWVGDGMVEFSADISAAWEVVEKMNQMKWRFYSRSITYNDGLIYKSIAAQFQNEHALGIDTGYIDAETMSLAICRAALLTTLESE